MCDSQKLVLLTYPVFGRLYSSCWAVKSGVQVFSTRCLIGHVQRQHKAPGKYSAHCVVHLRKPEIYVSGHELKHNINGTYLVCFHVSLR